ncbi:MAG: hypothetical protein EPN68_01845 [Rhodanobacter sp.]|nr:MAG: hypothetical protein EPN68_01845 [Rhodanobacter sp.]
MNLVLGQQSVDDADSLASRGEPRLVLSLDNREWLAFLADDWWPLSGDTGGVHLGVNLPLHVKSMDGRARVLVELELARLPDLGVQVYRDGAWRAITAGQIAHDDQEVVWPGPLPIFAVSSFVVATAEERDHLLAVAHGFSNIESPVQPFRIQVCEEHEPAATVPKAVPAKVPPKAWNALRGAAAMAAWSVPAVDPWLDTLCQALSETPSPVSTLQEAPWWETPPWRLVGTAATSQVALWEAMKSVLADIKIREGWVPQDVLTEITEQARRLGGEAVPLQALVRRTRDILLDRAAIDLTLADENPLGLVLQLLLLRPTAEHFVTWRSELPGMPPAVWWTGATLAGFLTGYRDLAGC